MDGAVLNRLPAGWAARLTPESVTRAIAVAGGLIVLWNALAYPSIYGYDAASHREYADYLVQHRQLPLRPNTPEYYSPPLYYLLAGLADAVGRGIGLGNPWRLGQILNVPAVVGAVLLVAATARLLWPERPRLAPAAAAFLVLSPVLTRTASMFHPEPTDLFFSALCGYLAVRMLVRHSYGTRAAVGLGLALGAAQMVRQFALYTLAVVVAGWLVAAWSRPRERAALLRALAVALAACAVVAGPWYGYRAAHYGNALFDRPSPSTKPFFERRPAGFYLDPGLPDLFSRPYRPNMADLAWPQTYADVWGDWYGVFAWSSRQGRPSTTADGWLVAQDVIGIVPTAIALAGWLALLGVAMRRRAGPLLAVALLPLAGLAGYFYFAIGYPTPDGDVLKPTFMLSTLWAWALCFAWLAGRLAARWPRLVGATLGLLALADLPFVVYRGGVGLL
jgi:hypothetical protein